MTEQAKKTRQRRDLAQVAQEQLDKADRLIKRLKEREGKLHEELLTVQTELEAAQKRREYLAANPDLRSGEAATAAPEVPSAPSGDPFDF
jgi:hypothetical protein